MLRNCMLTWKYITGLLIHFTCQTQSPNPMDSISRTVSFISMDTVLVVDLALSSTTGSFLSFLPPVSPCVPFLHCL